MLAPFSNPKTETVMFLQNVGTTYKSIWYHFPEDHYQPLGNSHSKYRERDGKIKLGWILGK
jgi:ketopantoate reductase